MFSLFWLAIESPDPRLLARIIHEGFYCNRRYAAATSLTAGGLAAQSVNIRWGLAPFFLSTVPV